MKRQIIAGIVFGFFFVSSGFGALMAIGYETTPIDGGRWQNSYNVMNISLSVPIEEFTIWFDYGLYANLNVETPKPLADDWDEIVWQPETVLGDDGAYDAVAKGVGIKPQDGWVGKFIVSFDWLGEGEPGKQFYEIIDPVTLGTLDSGWTPEPGTVILLGLGAMALWKKLKA